MIWDPQVLPSDPKKAQTVIRKAVAICQNSDKRFATEYVEDIVVNKRMRPNIIKNRFLMRLEDKKDLHVFPQDWMMVC